MLRDLDLEKKTIVFFCGDNGGNDYFKDAKHPRGFHGANVHPETKVEFRGKKGNLYEGGLRIPMIVRWPGQIKPGRVSDLCWYFADVLPTLAELAGAKAPDDIDGLSIVPELLGEDVAGRKQAKHEFLYWELGQQTAVRMGQFKAIRPRRNRPWELYDLTRDVSEKNDIASDHKDVLAKMTSFAEQAHEPAREGVFHDREIHEKDRRAKWGDTRPPQSPRKRKRKVNALPRRGLISNAKFKVVRASSQSGINGKLAKHAIDGDPETIWHTQWQSELARHPHELVIDLGGERTIRGFRYLARQDEGWNGTIQKCEFYASATPDDFGEPVTTASFTKSKKSQEAVCEPIKARYVLVRILSEVSGGPWASVAELGIVGG